MSKKRSFKLLVPVFYILLLLTTASATPLYQQNNRITLRDGNSWFLAGVNYPWLNYGHDFGTTAWGHDGVSADASTEQIDKDFADLESHNVHVVRWFVFGDGRASPEFDDNGLVTGLDEYFFPDFDQALALAQKHNIYLMPVLFDFHMAEIATLSDGVQLGGRANLIEDPDVQQSFVDNALKPLLDRYWQHPNIVAWDIINEPEGAMKIEGGAWVGDSVNPPSMFTFVDTVLNYIHRYPSQLVTLGSASRGWLPYWKGTNVDFFQYHYYDAMETDYPFDYPASELGLDKPVIIGEFPTADTKLSLKGALDAIWDNGYAGALAWSYRDTTFSDFIGQAKDFSNWSNRHASEVQITAPLTTASTLDFETAISGWYNQTYEDSQACYKVEQSDAVAYDGSRSLAMLMDIVGGHENKSKGEAFAVLSDLESTDIIPPIDLTDQTITIWVFPPENSQGNPKKPNGFQVFVKDEQGNAEYGVWHNIDHEGIWMPVMLQVSSTVPRDQGLEGYMQEGFDPAKISTIGIKMGIGDPNSWYKGSIYIDAISWK